VHQHAAVAVKQFVKQLIQEEPHGIRLSIKLSMFLMGNFLAYSDTFASFPLRNDAIGTGLEEVYLVIARGRLGC
jgi:hypothetical protein